MIKVLTTTEISNKTGLTDRSVRRRLGNELVRVEITQGNRTLLGSTQESVKAFVKSQKTNN